MNSIFIIISSGLVGAGVGYLVGDWVSYQMQLSYFRDVIDEMLESSEPAEISMKVDTSKVTIKSDISDNGKPAVNYAKIKTEEKPSLIDLVDKVVEDYDTDGGPQIISEEEFNASSLDYANVVYFVEDGVYAIAYSSTDEQYYTPKEVIEDPQDIFGPNIHLHFGEQAESPDDVFVYSPNDMMCYSIQRVPSSYKREELGIPDEEEKKEPKAAPKRRARKAAKVIKEEQEDADS